MKKTTKAATIEAARKWEDANRRKKEAEREEKEARAILEAALDAASVDMLEAGAYIITREHTTRRALNQRKLKEEHPDIVAAFTEPQARVTFKVTK